MSRHASSIKRARPISGVPRTLVAEVVFQSLMPRVLVQRSGVDRR